jgi:hypothetical protein
MSDYCADAKRECDLLQRLTAERTQRERAESDYSELANLHRAVSESFLRFKNEYRAIQERAEQAEAREQVALADNAALVEACEKHDVHCPVGGLGWVGDEPHPGDAIREELERLRDMHSGEAGLTMEQVCDAIQPCRRARDAQAEAKRYREGMRGFCRQECAHWGPGCTDPKKQCPIYQALNAGKE